MLSNRNGISLLGAGALLALSSLIASATTVVQTFTIPATPVPFTYPITFNLFDSNLGSLTGVTLDLTTSSVADVNIANLTGTPQPFTNATATFPLTITGPPGTTTYVTTSISAGPISDTAPVGSSDFPASATADSGNVNVPGADFGSFQAPGGGTSATDLVFASGAGSYSGSAVAGVLFGGSGTVSGTLVLTYTYQEPSNGTPEPGTWAFLAATATVSVAGLRRRRALK